MAEVSAFINARPFIPVSHDPDVPEVLTPVTLLTQQLQQLKQPAGDLSAENLSHKQWKHVQHLANVFWSRWRREYLPMLQPPRKWQNTTCNVQKGDFKFFSTTVCTKTPQAMTGLLPELPSTGQKANRLT